MCSLFKMTCQEAISKCHWVIVGSPHLCYLLASHSFCYKYLCNDRTCHLFLVRDCYISKIPLTGNFISLVFNYLFCFNRDFFTHCVYSYLNPFYCYRKMLLLAQGTLGLHNKQNCEQYSELWFLSQVSLNDTK